MNSTDHKKRAEALLNEVNGMRAESRSIQAIEMLISLAQVHATLATIDDSYDDFGL